MGVLTKIYKEQYVESTLKNIESKITNFKDISYYQLVTFYRKRLTVGLLLMITQQFSGCNAILTDSATLFNYNGNATNVKIYTIMTSVMLIVSSMLSGKLSDKFGRRTLLLWGNGGCAIILLVMGILQQPQFDTNTLEELSIYFTFVFIFVYGVSLAPISWVYEPEILPEKGVSLAVITCWLFCCFIVFFTPLLIEQIGISPLYYFFGFYLIFSHIQMYFTLHETKGKTNKEIDEAFGNIVAYKEIKEENIDDRTTPPNTSSVPFLKSDQ